MDIFEEIIAAKKAGVKVERFSLGFGKKLVGIKKGDTEYIISAFPFGGYVKMAGDNPAELKGAPEEFFSKGALKRFFIIGFRHICVKRRRPILFYSFTSVLLPPPPCKRRLFLFINHRCFLRANIPA